MLLCMKHDQIIKSTQKRMSLNCERCKKFCWIEERITRFPLIDYIMSVVDHELNDTRYDAIYKNGFRRRDAMLKISNAVKSRLLALLGVGAADGGLGVLSTEGEGDAVLGELLLPDAVAAIGAGAGVEAVGAIEGEVAALVDGEAGALGVLGGGLSTGGVADLATAHAGAVDVDWSRWSVLAE